MRLPTGVRVVCGASEATPNGVSLWFPLGALARVEDRVEGFPFGDDRRGSSLPWRRPLDGWLAEVAQKVHEEVRLRFGLIGFDVVGEVKDAKFALPPPEERGFGYLVPDNDRLRYFAATF